MNFALLLPIQDNEVGLHHLVAELREDAVYLPEFHQSRGGALVSPLLLCALAGGRDQLDHGGHHGAGDAVARSDPAGRGRFERTCNFSQWAGIIQV